MKRHKAAAGTALYPGVSKGFIVEGFAVMVRPSFFVCRRMRLRMKSAILTQNETATEARQRPILHIFRQFVKKIAKKVCRIKNYVYLCLRNDINV